VDTKPAKKKDAEAKDAASAK